MSNNEGSGEAERTVFLNSFQDREAEYCPPDFYIIKIWDLGKPRHFSLFRDCKRPPTQAAE